MTSLHSIRDLDVSNKKVIVRVDLNLPRNHGRISDNSRIIRLLPTINYLQQHNAKIILISHLGRPKGIFKRELSLAPVVNALEKILACNVYFCIDAIGDGAIESISKLKSGEIILLENLRFYPGEEENNIDFIMQLKQLGDIFINDTFSCSHRAHSSIVGLTKILPSAAGFLLESELNNLQTLLSMPTHPFTVIIGGSKISTKLSLLLNLITKADNIIITGAMANTFLATQGYNIGGSLHEPDLLEYAKKILTLSIESKCRILLPSDVITSKQFQKKTYCQIKNINNVKSDDLILDIGPQTLYSIEHIVNNSATLVWNGPLGAFEYRLFDISTRSLARVIASKTTNGQLISIVGGGDTLAAINTTGLLNCFTYVSTGGGAFLEWLEGKILPGINALMS